jgi:hypothetical protein
VLKNLPESEKRCFITWCAATRSLCEIAGDLAFATSEDIRILQKLLLAPKNGREVRIGEWDHLGRNEPAGIVFAPGDLFSQDNSPCTPTGVLAVFNWSDGPRTLDVRVESLGLEQGTTWLDADFFESAEPPQLRESAWQVTLPARSVRLSHLTALPQGQPAILDSNWAVTANVEGQSSLELKLSGNAPEGFLLSWQFGAAPSLTHSNLEASITLIAPQVYRVAPAIAAGESCTEWAIGLA